MKKIFLITGLFICATFANIYAAGSEHQKSACPTVEKVSQTNVSCFGGNNGAAGISISGGSGNFTITWSSGETNVSSVSNLAAGYYDVMVVDNESGCSKSAFFNISQPARLMASSTVNDVKCFGESTGQIMLNVSGGTMPYTYDWSNSVSTQNNTNVPAGSYTVQVTDSKGCQTSKSAFVEQPAQALGVSYTVSEVLCHNDANGKIDLTVWGGTAPYTYNWNNNSYNSQDLVNIEAGDYHVVVTDKNNCQETRLINLANPEPLQMSSVSSNNSCFGENNGEISLNVSGGTQPYTYSWANSDVMMSQNTPLLTNLPDNEYFVTVKDKNACSKKDNFSITSPPQIITTISASPVSNYGGSDGQIQLEVSGGIQPYTYKWSNGATTQNVSNVTAGLHEVEIADANSCIAYASVLVSQPAEPLIASYVKKDVTCYGGEEGEIFAYVSGGEKPYSYTWSTGSNLSYVHGLTASTYILTINDAGSSQIRDTFYIEEPEPFNFEHNAQIPSCYGESDGMIDLTVTGGTAPYSYYWYDNTYALAGFNKTLTNVKAGLFTVELVDTFSCRAYYTVQLEQPQKLQLTFEQDNVQCAGDATGNITPHVRGGTPPYKYDWSNGTVGNEANNLSAGNYYLIVSDENGCNESAEFFISEADPIIIDLMSSPVSCEDQSDGYIYSVVSGGHGGYSYLWSNQQTDDAIYDLTYGEYHLTVTDILGCRAEAQAFVESSDAACLTIPSVFTPNADGINDLWVIRNIELYPNCRMQVFNKWGKLVFESKGYTQAWDGTYRGSMLPAGTYYYVLSFDDRPETLKGTISIIK